MEQTETAGRHVYLLGGRNPRQKQVLVVDGELCLTDEAWLWTGDPMEKIPQVMARRDHQGLLSADRADALTHKIKATSGVIRAYRNTWTIVVTALEDLAWPGITHDIVQAVADVTGTPLKDVHLHDTTDIFAMNVYVVGQQGSTVRYIAVSHRPLRASEVEDLLERHQFSPESSANDELLAANNWALVDDIWLLDGVDEAENEGTLMCVVTRSPDVWDTDLATRIAQAYANSPSITTEHVRTHDLSVAA